VLPIDHARGPLLVVALGDLLRRPDTNGIARAIPWLLGTDTRYE
jgi:hypothetical protein